MRRPARFTSVAPSKSRDAMTRAMPKPTVLVVDDEAVIRQGAVEMVEEAGFTALEARDGTQAMELLDTVAGIGVIVTDIDMPGSIDGVRLAACVHRRWPRVGIIVASGKVSPKRGDIPAGGHFFAKPYVEADVVAAIRALLNRMPAGS